jgi:hypothetical protein
MNEEEAEIDEFHRDYLMRYMEYELRRQEVISDRYLSERKPRHDASDLKQIKVARIES